MKKKTKPGAIQQLLSYAGNNKKQLYLSTFLATLGELFGMAPFITVSLLVAELFNKTATISYIQYVPNGCVYFTSAYLQEYVAKCTYRAKPVEKKATYRNVRGNKSHL